MDLYLELLKITSDKNVFKDEPMSKHTTFRTGGNADFLVIPSNKDELIKILKLDAPKTIIGNGSNLLVKDGGVRGIVIKTTGLKNYYVEGDYIVAESGVMLPKLSNIARENSLTGLEFACGIPGTLGGGVMMNAGAYGGEMKDVVVETTYADLSGNLYTITNHAFGYRKSIFTGTDYIILESKLKLSKGDIEKISEIMKDYTNRRIEKQPLEKPNAGSTFKRPEGYFVGKLIEDAGLKGYKIGGAQVSSKHAGFIVNSDKATSKDVLDLIKYVQDKVKNEFGVDLEPEVRVIGE